MCCQDIVEKDVQLLCSVRELLSYVDINLGIQTRIGDCQGHCDTTAVARAVFAKLTNSRTKFMLASLHENSQDDYRSQLEVWALVIAQIFAGEDALFDLIIQYQRGQAKHARPQLRQAGHVARRVHYGLVRLVRIYGPIIEQYCCHRAHQKGVE